MSKWGRFTRVNARSFVRSEKVEEDESEWERKESRE